MFVRNRVRMYCAQYMSSSVYIQFFLYCLLAVFTVSCTLVLILGLYLRQSPASLYYILYVCILLVIKGGLYFFSKSVVPVKGLLKSFLIVSHERSTKILSYSLTSSIPQLSLFLDFVFPFVKALPCHIQENFIWGHVQNI